MDQVAGFGQIQGKIAQGIIWPGRDHRGQRVALFRMRPADGLRHIPSGVLHFAPYRHRAQWRGTALPAYAYRPSGHGGLVAGVEIKQAHGGGIDDHPRVLGIGQGELQGQIDPHVGLWNPNVQTGVGLDDMLIPHAKMAGDIQQRVAFLKWNHTQPTNHAVFAVQKKAVR